MRTVLVAMVALFALSSMNALAESGTNPVVSVGEKKEKRAKLDEPIVLADGLEILHYWFPPNPQPDEARVFGLMRNTTDVALDAVAIKFSLYDVDGNVLGSITAKPIYHVAPPGEVLPFEGDTYEPPYEPSEIAYAELSTCDAWGTNQNVTELGFGFDGLSIEIKDPVQTSASEARIEGIVKNDSGAPVEVVRIVGAFFDREGRFIGFEQTYIDATIPDGKTGRFALEAYAGFSTQKRPLEYAGGDYAIDVWAGIDSQVWFLC